MSNLHFNIIAALTGGLIIILLGFAVQSDEHSKVQQNQQEHDLFGSAPSKPTSVEQPEKNLESEQSCKPGEDNRNSDLCAQWKAADAAAESATWTKVSAWIAASSAFVGVLTLGAAVAAAIFARAAAMHTESAAIEARRSADNAADANHIAQTSFVAQTRAWLSISCELVRDQKHTSTNDGRSGVFFNVECKVFNHGASPATHVSFHAELSFNGGNMIEIEDRMNNYGENMRSRGVATAEAVFPNASFETGHMVFLERTEAENSIANQGHHFIIPVVIGCINYQTPAMSGVRQTRFAYHVITLKGEQNMTLSADDPEWTQKEMYLAGPGVMNAD